MFLCGCTYLICASFRNLASFIHRAELVRRSVRRVLSLFSVSNCRTL